MDFKNSYRIEAVYFNKLKSDIDIAKSYIAVGATDEARAVLENLVDVNGAVLLLYRNIGECWAELANAIEKTKKELDALRDQQEQYHDELNEKIDEINNYIIRLINALDERLTAAEADIDDLQDRMTQAESDIDDLEANKQDKLTAGFGIEIDANNEISVDTDDVQEKLTAGFGIEIDANNEISVDTDDVQEKLTAGFGIEIDANNEISVDTDDVQEKLTAGFGIEIDANNEISVDTDDVQEKLIAGQNITLTPDSTDPTKTVIDAQSGTNYTAGKNIEIVNDVIENVFGNNLRIIPGTVLRTVRKTLASWQTNGVSGNNDRAAYFSIAPSAHSTGLHITKTEFNNVKRVLYVVDVSFDATKYEQITFNQQYYVYVTSLRLYHTKNDYKCEIPEMYFPLYGSVNPIGSGKATLYVYGVNDSDNPGIKTKTVCVDITSYIKAYFDNNPNDTEFHMDHINFDMVLAVTKGTPAAVSDNYDVCFHLMDGLICDLSFITE